MTPTRPFGSFPITVVVFAVLTTPAYADTFEVNTFEDGNDGACDVNGCTLREAVILTTGTDGPDEIVLQAGTYNLVLPGNSEDSALAGDLDINLGEVTIRGRGPGVTVIDANQIDRAFHVGPWSTATLVLRDLTVRNGGNAAGGYGGGIMVFPNGSLVMDNVELTQCTGFSNGGGIYVHGTATITDSRLSGNVCSHSSGNGGAIYASGIVGPGEVTVTRSLFRSNDTGNGGSACFTNFAAAMFENCTFSNNTSDSTLATNAGTIHLESCTVSNNAWGLANFGVLTISNTIVANSSVRDIVGTITSQGYNLVENVTGGTIVGDGTGNLLGVDPMLGPLEMNGGSTLTRVLLPGSPARDAANPTDFPAVDQRSFGRPVDGDGDGETRADMGATEADAAPLGDIDGDGAVRFSDLLIILGSWGPCEPPPADCPADLDGDGMVGFSDILIVLANWS